MSLYEIPVQPTPQVFDIALAGTVYTLTCKWNDQLGGAWIMDITDSVSGLDILTGIALTTGVDLLSGYEYLGINGELYVYTDSDPYAEPTLDSLGVDSHLYFQTDADT